MVVYLALGAAILAVLVWTARQSRGRVDHLRLVGVLFATLAAVGAVVMGLRGEWPLSVPLVLLSAYLAQAGRRRAGSPPPRERADGTMSLEQARSILGVGPAAGRAEIDLAYRRLIRRAHPDQGGTSGLAAQLNAARDRLLK